MLTLQFSGDYRFDFLSLNEFNDAIAEAEPGETIVYAVGSLAEDIFKFRHMPDVYEARGTASLALRLESDREVLLTQERLPDRRFAYRATKTSVGYRKLRVRPCLGAAA